MAQGVCCPLSHFSFLSSASSLHPFFLLTSRMKDPLDSSQNGGICLRYMAMIEGLTANRIEVVKDCQMYGVIYAWFNVYVILLEVIDFNGFYIYIAISFEFDLVWSCCHGHLESDRDTKKSPTFIQVSPNPDDKTSRARKATAARMCRPVYRRCRTTALCR